MIGPSDLYRVPACLSPSQSQELLRYARLEHEAEGLAWTLPAAARVTREFGIRRWLVSRLGLERAAVRPAHLRTGVAAVHFDEDSSHDRAAEPLRAEDHHPCGVLANCALLVTVQPNHPGLDESCLCEQ